MATLSASRRNSANSNPNTPRTSISGTLPRMSSLSEEASRDITVKLKQDEKMDRCLNVKDVNQETIIQENSETDFKQPDNFPSEHNEVNDTYTPLKVIKDIRNENNKIRTRACSERSDSGISDCSSHLTSNSCTSTPLLSKKFCINEETENSHDNKNYISTTTLLLNYKNRDETPERNGESRRSSNSDKSVLFADEVRISPDKILKEKPPLNLKLSNRIETFSNGKPVKCK